MTSGDRPMTRSTSRCGPGQSRIQLFCDLTSVASIVVLSSAYSHESTWGKVVWLVLASGPIWDMRLATTLMLDPAALAGTVAVFALVPDDRVAWTSWWVLRRDHAIDGRTTSTFVSSSTRWTFSGCLRALACGGALLALTTPSARSGRCRSRCTSWRGWSRRGTARPSGAWS